MYTCQYIVLYVRYSICTGPVGLVAVVCACAARYAVALCPSDWVLLLAASGV